MKENDSVYVFSGFYFDTFISVTIYDTCNEQIISGLEDLCIYYDQLLSEDNENSDIYKLNTSSGNCVSVNEETSYLINQSLIYSKATDGRLDLTIQGVQELWDFENQIIPEASAIDEALKNVDYRQVSIYNGQVCIGKNQKITLGFIGKGYIADMICRYLLDSGIKNALINLGGNLLCMGNKPDGNAYTVGIQRPFAEGETALSLKLTDKSLVTSGLYERCILTEDTIYHHILNTKTGYPVHNYKKDEEAELWSVSIIGESSEICDCLSTILFILGEEEGNEFLNDYPSYEAVYIYSDNSISYSHDFSEDTWN